VVEHFTETNRIPAGAHNVSVHAWGHDRLKVEQRRCLSIIALELLTSIIPSMAGNSILGMQLVPHVMANFAVVSSTSSDHRYDLAGKEHPSALTSRGARVGTN
jgi:hypothetical protein